MSNNFDLCSLMNLEPLFTLSIIPDNYIMPIEQARKVLKIEAQSILGMIKKLGPEFEKAIDIILKSKGRVILTGMGKSGLIARKISATLNSTGTPSLFLHPGEAIHGDLGMVTHDDVVLAISNSGQTAEINTILPILNNMGSNIISFTGGLESPMAMISDVVIDVGVKREACPLGLAPTASTTAALAMGDALAVVLLNRRSFNEDDFKKFHPGGSLGERLSISVSEIMLTGGKLPLVLAGSKVQSAIEEINAKGLGAAFIIDKDQMLAGIITDGDLRRALIKGKNILEMNVEEIMSPSPKTIDENKSAAEALELMELKAITHLAILNRSKRIKGIVHLHDLLGREEFKVNGGFHSTKRAYR